jgi:hypothetical protein
MRYVTQMEHYSLHEITDVLDKLHYGVLHWDPERLEMVAMA